MKILHHICAILVIVGALNWGLVGAFNLNLVEVLFGMGTKLTKIVYILVGLSALGAIYHITTKHPKKDM